MKVVCFECKKQLGEKAPFSDDEATHTLCDSCLRETLERLRERHREQKEKRSRYHADGSSRFKR
jgi:predicted sulfurtransferase